MSIQSSNSTAVADAHRVVKEELVRLPAPVADQVRDLLEDAVRRQDAEVIRREGNQWSGRIGVMILELADRIAEAQQAAVDSLDEIEAARESVEQGLDNMFRRLGTPTTEK